MNGSLNCQLSRALTMLGEPAIPIVFINKDIQRRNFTKFRPETVLLNMRKEAQRSYVEKIEIYHTTSILAEQIESVVSQKRQTRVLPNILRNSTSKVQSKSEISLSLSETCNMNAETTLLEIPQENTEVDKIGNRRQAHKRKQDYRETNIRKETPRILKRKTNIPSRQTPRKIKTLSISENNENEVSKNMEIDLIENTEINGNNVPLSTVLVDPVSNNNDYAFFQERETVPFESSIDFSSNDIFSRCYYDSYSSQSIDHSLELNERLDDIQSILNCSFSRDTPSKQCVVNGNDIGNKIPNSLDSLTQIHDAISFNNTLPVQEEIWMHEWLSGKEIELDAVFQNAHFSEHSKEDCDDNFITLDSLSRDHCTDLPENISNDVEMAERDFIGYTIDFSELNLTLIEEAIEKILNTSADDLTEVLMKEIDEMDANDLYSHEAINNIDQEFSSDELTEMMLLALIEEAYPSIKSNILNENLRETKEYSRSKKSGCEIELSESETNSYSNKNGTYDKELKETEVGVVKNKGTSESGIGNNKLKATEVCTNRKNSIGDEELEEAEITIDDSMDSLEEANTPFTPDINTGSPSTEDERQTVRSVIETSLSTDESDVQKENEKTFECRMCPLRFRYRRTLALHRAAAHKGLYYISCETCGRRFNRQYAYHRHSQYCDRTKKVFKCEDCPKEYRYKSSLVSHIWSKHGKYNGRSKKYICKVCSKSYNTVSRYNTHMRDHENNW